MVKSIDERQRKTVFIASGDLSHRLKMWTYGYREEGPNMIQNNYSWKRRVQFLIWMKFSARRGQ
jgi:hypothetical protein